MPLLNNYENTYLIGSRHVNGLINHIEIRIIMIISYNFFSCNTVKPVCNDHLFNKINYRDLFSNVL